MRVLLPISMLSIFVALLSGCREDIESDADGPPAITADELREKFAQPKAESLDLPDEPCSGRIASRFFAAEHATLAGTVLSLTQGPELKADVELTLFFFLYGVEKPSDFNNKRILLEDSPLASIPVAHVTVTTRSKTGKKEEKTFTKGVIGRIEFGESSGEKIPCSLHLKLPDGDRSEIKGTIQADMLNLSQASDLKQD